MSSILRTLDDAEYAAHGPDFSFWCPACNSSHEIWTKPRPSPSWTFDGNAEKPTFAPSLLIESMMWTPPVTPENLEQWQAAPWPQSQVRKVCHIVITAGILNFQPDCDHALRGQAVPMVPFPI